MQPFQIKLKTITPLWTGGVDGRSDRLRETGIIGSLRWWYEAIVRGLGGSACDPTDHRCRFDEERFKQPEPDEFIQFRLALHKAGVCDACQAYGTTGWARRFRLHMRGGKQVDFDGSLRIKPHGRNRGWFLLAGLAGKPQGTVVKLPRYAQSMLIAPLYIADRWGGLGARTQHGYGVVKAIVVKEKTPILVNETILQSLPQGSQTDDKGMPSLQNMFFAKANVQTDSKAWWKETDGLPVRSHDRGRGKLEAWVKTNSVPISPVVRNQIRFVDGLGLHGYGPRNFIFGSSQRVCKACYQRVRRIEVQSSVYSCGSCGRIHESKTLERTKTRIHISAAYPLDKAQKRWQVRIWGWLPRTLPDHLSMDRDRVLQALYDLLSEAGTWRAALGKRMTFRDIVWREFNSTRDHVTGQTTDVMKFLGSLLLEGKGQ